MMTSSNGNIFRVTGHLCGEFTGPRWIPTQRPMTRSFDFSLICVWINDWVNNREAGDLRRYLAHHDVTVMWRAVIGTCHTEFSQVTHPGTNPVRWHNRQCSNYLVELVAHSMPTHFTAIGSTPKGFIIDNTQRLSLMKNLLKLEYSHSRKCHLIYHWHFAPLR